MSQSFPNLFSPLQVGKYSLRNRIVCTGHATKFEVAGRFTERHLHYYRERARGGAGMIVTEGASVHPTGTFPLWLHDDEAIPMLRKIGGAVHEFDAPILVQISHAGRRVPSPSGVLETVIVAPSAVPAPTQHFGQVMPHELSIEEVEELVRAFGEAARRVRDAGIDGVELSIAFGNLIPQFLSEASNRRSDRYGGSAERRMTFALEVIDEIRTQMGSELLLGVRFTDDDLDYSMSMRDLAAIAPALEKTGALDYISVAAGTNYDLKSAASIIPSHYHTPGQFAPLAAEIKELVDLPVIGVGRINSPELAEKLLMEGQMDLVGMARELIADPHLPRKAREGRVEEIRPCVACNQSCKGHQAAGLPITCIYNPVSGREAAWAEIKPADECKKVLVVGGGPAGMEAARVAAVRGHAVVLFERADALGGQINAAVRAPHREEFGKIVDFLSSQLERLDVDVRQGREADADAVMAERPDAVVVATGSTPHKPAIPGAEAGNVLTAWDVLGGSARTGERVVVIDTQGLRPGCDVANHLAGQGKQVELVTGMSYVGQGIQAGVWRHLYEELLRQGVKMSPLTGVAAIGESTVETYHTVYTDPSTARMIEAVDTVVFASGGRADDRLFKALRGRVDELHAVGDCVQPRDVEAAVYEGHRVGRLL